MIMRIHVTSHLTLPALFVCASMLPGQEIIDESYDALDGTSVLRQSVVVPATVDSVWHAFTTTPGIQSWAVPVAEVDFRAGGIWESTYQLDGRIGNPDNIKNRFLSYLPFRMISIQAIQAPLEFPHPELLSQLFSVIELEEVEPGCTRVTISGVGHRNEERYRDIHDHFRQGNAWSLQMLHRRFSEGPVDWHAILGGHQP
jgi:uncharacterized protein YndB with AHSA1/START domain